MEERLQLEQPALTFKKGTFPREENILKTVIDSMLRAAATTAYKYEDMRVLLYDSFFIAGGAISSLFSGREVNDYDVFAKDRASLVKMLEMLDDCYYAQAHDPNAQFKQDYVSDNAKTYAVSDGKGKTLKFQFITRKTGSVVEILKYFDMVQCMGAFDGKYFYMEDRFLYCNATKQMRISPILIDHPMVTVFRCLKYTKYGYTIPASELLDLLLQVQNLSLRTYQDVIDNMTSLEEGLVQDLLKDDRFALDNPYEIEAVRNIIKQNIDIHSFVNEGGQFNDM